MHSNEQDKLAGLWERGIFSAVNVGFAIAQQKRLARAHEESVVDALERRRTLHHQMRPTNEALSRTRVPAMLSPEMGRNVPVGFEYGMIRLASAIGTEMAQEEMEKEARGVGTLLRNVFSRGGAKATAAAGNAAANTAGTLAASASKVKAPSGGGFRPQTPNPTKIPPPLPIPGQVKAVGVGPSTVRSPSGSVSPARVPPTQRAQTGGVPVTQRGGAPLSSAMGGPPSAPMTQPASTQVAPTRVATPAQSPGSVLPVAPAAPQGGYSGASATMPSAQPVAAQQPPAGQLNPAVPPPPTPNGKPALPAPRQKPLPQYDLEGQQPAGLVAPAKPMKGTGRLPPVPHPKVQASAAPEHVRPILNSAEATLGKVPGFHEAQRAALNGDAAPLRELLRRNPAARKNFNKHVQESGAAKAYLSGPAQPGHDALVAAAGGGAQPPSAGTVTPAAAAEGAGKGNATQNFMSRTGLFNPDGSLRTGRIGLMGAGLGAGYLAYQGGKALVDDVASHPAQYTYNTGANQVAGGLNQYGYPQY